MRQMALRLLKGYKALALVEIGMCICFFLYADGDIYGTLYSAINFFAAGFLLVIASLAYFNAKKWRLWVILWATVLLTIINLIWFITNGVFISVGFPLIAYNLLFITGNLHFLGKGL